jgi:uncharacterized protein YaiE (UPF0345 family)
MAVGEYTFGTAKPEEMTVISGSLKVLILADLKLTLGFAAQRLNQILD